MFTIDPMSRCPVYEQIIKQLERFVLTGVLKPGSQLPSVRSLSAELGINPNTIQKAYSELDTRGVVCTVPGKGGFISQNATALLYEYKLQKLSELRDMVNEMALAGIAEEDLLCLIQEVYSHKETPRKGRNPDD